MDKNARLSFPFTVRDMLSFQHGAKLQLKIVSQSTSASPVIIRGMTSEGAFSFVHIPTNNAVIATETFGISDIPIMVSVQDKDQTLVQGDTYITLTLLINGDPLYELCSGLVYRQKSISYPTGSNIDIRPGGGKLKEITTADPAAGAEVSQTVPAGQIWKVIGIRATLTTDGTVANRRVQLKFQSQSNTIEAFWSNTDQTASTTESYHFSGRGGMLQEHYDVKHSVVIPQNIMLIPGDIITTETTNLAGGDNFGVARIMVEQWFNPA